MTRQSGFRLVFSAIHKSQKRKTDRTFAGEVILVKGHTPVCTVKFWIDKTHINITDLNAHQRHRRCGYGRLTMDYMMFLAEILRKPLFLYSATETVKFYEKIGMEHVNSKKMKQRIVVLNEDPKNKHFWTDEDMIWIPKCLQCKKTLWVYM